MKLPKPGTELLVVYEPQDDGTGNVMGLVRYTVGRVYRVRKRLQGWISQGDSGPPKMLIHLGDFRLLDLDDEADRELWAKQVAEQLQRSSG